METTMHNVVAVVAGRISRLENTGSYTREVTITTSRGERLIIKLFGDRESELNFVSVDQTYPSHSLRAA